MYSKQKDIAWISVVVGFYILTAVWGLYGLGITMTWPLFAVPMSLLLIQTGQKEVVGLIGVILAVVISFITTGTFNPIIVSIFLLFILAPTFLFAMMYRERVVIPRIIIMLTILIFLSGIIFIMFSKRLGIDYIGNYFEVLDVFQSMLQEEFIHTPMLQSLYQGENAPQMYEQALGTMVLQAKRTYPATLFIMSLIGSISHVLMVQLFAYIRSWKRPFMKDILKVGLSPVSVWVLLGLWITMVQMNDSDTIWTFAIESMVVVLLTMFQIMGMISLIAMIRQMGLRKIFRGILVFISIFWLIFNPTLLMIIGCIDSIFNFRKVKALI